MNGMGRCAIRLGLVASLASALTAGAAPVSRTVDLNGVSLSYLDWGGEGAALAFVPGGCETGHIFSDIAPAFQGRFRVLSLRPRGCGASAVENDSLGLDTQVRDLARFLDALDIDRATFAGHSSGGGKIIRFARVYPSRVDRLVLFDTVYSFVAPGFEQRMGAAISNLVRGDPLDSVELFEAHHRVWELGSWSAALEANLRETFSVQADGTLRSRAAPAWFAAYRNDMAAGWYFETTISHPALLFFATNLDQERVRQLNPSARAELMPLAIQTDRKRLEQIEDFRSNGPHVQIVQMKRTAHYCFVQRPRRIIRNMRVFFAASAP